MKPQRPWLYELWTLQIKPEAERLAVLSLKDKLIASGKEGRNNR